MLTLFIILMAIDDIGFLHGVTGFINLNRVPRARFDAVFWVGKHVLGFKPFLLGSLGIKSLDEPRLVMLLLFGGSLRRFYLRHLHASSFDKLLFGIGFTLIAFGLGFARFFELISFE